MTEGPAPAGPGSYDTQCRTTASSTRNIVLGTPQPDRLVGTDGPELILGYDGADTLRGGAGNDTLLGYAGVDNLSGGVGDDLLLAENLNLDLDPLRGGVEIARGGPGNDVARAAEPRTYVEASERPPTDPDLRRAELYGDDGDDILDGGPGTDRLFGGTGVDQLNGNGGADSLDGGAGADYLDGGTGTDRREPADSSDRDQPWLPEDGPAAAGVRVPADPRPRPQGPTLVVPPDLDTCQFHMWDMYRERGTLAKGNGRLIVGSDSDDVLIGTPGRDVILGYGGNDVLRGLGENDMLCGGPGEDRIEGGDGEDRIVPGTGRDDVRGDGDGIYAICGDDDAIDGGRGSDGIRHGPGDTVAQDPADRYTREGDLGSVDGYRGELVRSLVPGPGYLAIAPLTCDQVPRPEEPAVRPDPDDSARGTVAGVAVAYLTESQLPRTAWREPWYLDDSGYPFPQGDDDQSYVASGVARQGVPRGGRGLPDRGLPRRVGGRRPADLRRVLPERPGLRAAVAQPALRGR